MEFRFFVWKVVTPPSHGFWYHKDGTRLLLKYLVVTKLKCFERYCIRVGIGVRTGYKLPL